MPLLDTGFEPQTYEEWLLNIQTMLRQQLGIDIDLSTGSYLESLSESLARQLAQSDLTVQDVYDSRFYSLAEGVSLDRLAANLGLSRGAAGYATTIIQISGEPGYVVDAETMFSNNENRNYLTEEEVTIGPDGKVSVRVHAEETGEEYNCDANTITDQVMFVEEIEDVTNPEPASGGADMETDYDLHHRMMIASNAAESPTEDGIATALFAVPGVKSVRSTINNSPTVNEVGDPPYTSHLYVLGGDPQAVAQAISDHLAFGITLVGSQHYNVQLKNGDVKSIAFSVGSSQSIYMTLSVELEQSEGLDPNEVTQDIKDNIQVWLDEYSMGDKLRYTELFTVIYDVDGVKNVTDLSWGMDKDKMQRADIQLDNFSVATTNDDVIEVTING